MKTRHLALGLGALAAAALVAVLVARPTPARPANVTTPVPLAASTAIQAAVTPSCGLTAGQRLDVALTLQGAVEWKGGAAPLPRATVLTESLSATARLEVLEAGPSSLLLGHFTDVQVKGGAPADAYGQPFLLELDGACEVTRFARHESTTLADARAQQAALWELAWRRTDGPQSLTRSTARGRFVARATTAASPEGGVIAQRRLEAYLELWLGGAAQSVTGFSSVQAGDTGWFETLSSDETLTSSAGTTRTRVRAKVTPASGALTVDRDRSHYAWGDWLPRLVARREAMPVTAGDRALRTQVQGLTPAEAVQQVQAAFEREQNLAAAWPPLRAYLEARPEQTGEVVAQLKGGQVTEAGLNPFFIALGNARTPEAREALLALVHDAKAPPTVRARAMFGLVDRADVGVELARDLQSTSQALESEPTGARRFVASEALLALSTMSGLHEDLEVRAVALEAVRAQLRPGADRRSQGTALRALANLGDPALLVDAQPFTVSPDEGVRRAATKVVRRLSPADTEAFALQFLAREPSLLVKKDLFVTLEAQHFDAHAPASAPLARALLPELQSDAHGVIARKALLRLVGGSAISQEPAVRAVLKAQARRALARRDGLEGDVLQLLTPEEIREVAP
jgi:hypothetical protein